MPLTVLSARSLAPADKTSLITRVTVHEVPQEVTTVHTHTAQKIEISLLKDCKGAIDSAEDWTAARNRETDLDTATGW